MSVVSGLARKYLKAFLFKIPPVRRYLIGWRESRRRLERLKHDPRSEAIEQLMNAITSGCDLSSPALQQLTEDVEAVLQDPQADGVGVHREIGKAIFLRSPELYSGRGLPHFLVRYTYPPVISIALNSHCNAACFFCRDDDFKGDSVKFSDIKKLESAIRNARAIDLTGWGEPFFYPRLQEIVEYILSINPTRRSSYSSRPTAHCCRSIGVNCSQARCTG